MWRFSSLRATTFGTVALLGISDDLDWTNDEWSLSVGSAAIDSGDPAAPSDVDGSPTDMGAFGGTGGVWIP